MAIRLAPPQGFGAEQYGVVTERLTRIWLTKHHRHPAVAAERGSSFEMEPKNLGGKSGDARFSTVSYLKKQHGVWDSPDAVSRTFNALTLQHFKEVLFQFNANTALPTT